MSLSLSDPRVEWLSERVCLALEVAPEDFKHLLQEAYADRPAKERFMQELDGAVYSIKRFLSDGVKSGSAIFFFPVLEEVEEEYQVGRRRHITHHSPPLYHHALRCCSKPIASL